MPFEVFRRHLAALPIAFVEENPKRSVPSLQADNHLDEVADSDRLSLPQALPSDPRLSDQHLIGHRSAILVVRPARSVHGLDKRSCQLQPVGQRQLMQLVEFASC